MIKGVILGVSEVKWKPRGFRTYRGWTRAEGYRYIAVQGDDGHRYLVRMTPEAFERTPVDAEGNHITPKSGDIVQIEHYFYNPLYDLDDGTKMVFNPRIFTVLDHVTKESTQRYYLEGIKFFDWGVVLRNENSKCVLDKENWDALTGLETSFVLNKYKKQLKEEELKSAYVEITTRFKVYYGWRKDREWLLHRDDQFEWRLTSENLLPLKKVVIREEEARKARMLLDEIRQKLQFKLFLPWDDILALARKYTVEPSEVEEYVQNVTWKKDYDEAYAEYLKKKALKVLYGLDGLIFVMPGGITIIEEPVQDRATYVFFGAPDFIASQLEGIKRETGGRWRETLFRLKKVEPERFPWFIGRVIHYEFEQWKRDLNNILKGVVEVEQESDS